MLSQNGLSLDQAPPISVVFRFFFVGSLFGILCGIFVLFFQSAIFNAHSIEAVILTHALTLGVMLSFMFAALFQMLPVIAGVKLTSPVLKANLLLYPFVLGIIALLFAFNLTNNTWLFLLASVLLGTSLLGIVIIMVKNLFSLENHTVSSKGITYTLLSLGIVVLFALYLTSALAGSIEGSSYTQIKEAHYSFGLYGWIALLIISISFQVIEMFYVTPSYPKLVSKFMPVALFALLVVSSIVGIFYPSIWILADIVIALLLGSYALLTLKRFTQRKRPLTDATVWFWRLGLSSLLVSMLSLLLTLFMNNDSIKALSCAFFNMVSSQQPRLHISTYDAPDNSSKNCHETSLHSYSNHCQFYPLHLHTRAHILSRIIDHTLIWMGRISSCQRTSALQENPENRKKV